MAEHYVGKLSALKQHTGNLFQVSGRTLGIFRVDDEVGAYDNQCPHRAAVISRVGKESGKGKPRFGAPQDDFWGTWANGTAASEVSAQGTAELAPRPRNAAPAPAVQTGPGVEQLNYCPCAGNHRIAWPAIGGILASGAQITCPTA